MDADRRFNNATAERRTDGWMESHRDQASGRVFEPNAMYFPEANAGAS